MTDGEDARESEDWWQTGIIEMMPGVIRLRGYPIEELLGNLSFPAMIWLMLKGDLPSDGEAELLGTAMAAAVDHGPQAPSIAIARMAATCGVGINNAMASAINVLGDVHGGAGEQAVEMYNRIADEADSIGVDEATTKVLNGFFETGGKYVPGFGHRFHPVDPRAPRLLSLVDDAVRRGEVMGRFASIARGVERALERRKSRLIPMNIDGATAVIYAELGFPPPLCRGMFVLSRSVGILAHAWEESQAGLRNKGPIPRSRTWRYSGKPLRHFIPEN